MIKKKGHHRGSSPHLLLFGESENYFFLNSDTILDLKHKAEGYIEPRGAGSSPVYRSKKSERGTKYWSPLSFYCFYGLQTATPTLLSAQP